MSLAQYWKTTPVLRGRWTIKDIVQGKPLNHPSHALFVHFPSGLLPFAFVLDVLSRINPDLTLARAALYNVAFGLFMATGAAITGLVDYLPMIGGSRKKRLGTYHLLCQAPMVVLFSASLVLRALDYGADQTGVVAMALAGGGTLLLIVGNYFGGELVYRQGMRVNTGS